MERNVFSGKMAKIVDALVSSGESPFDKLMPFFEFINENVITLYGNESPFLYSALPIWSYMQGKFVERYPLKSRDATSLDQYTRLYDILNEMGFSFAGFLSHCIKRIPPCLEIKFFQGDRHLEISSTGLVVTLAFPIKQPILDKLKNSGWRNSYDVEENFVQNEFETFSEEIKKIAPILEVVTQSSSRELYWGFFKFLYAYAHVFSGPAIKSLYIVPAKVYKTKEKFDIGYGCLIMASDRECPFGCEGGDKTVKALSLLMNIIFSSWAIYDWADFRYFKDALTSTKAAIGAIMSRNGSHNIGSHVLAALSHNVGTMPDDRVLYQYIQQRMDYIANVTTESPSWTQPTMLLGSLMKGFLSQRHLLDHIAESEKLSAWKFQGTESQDKKHKGKHWIEFHVRRRNCDTYKELIEYPSGAVHLDKDVALAIPGGAVGYHAFYTILENIIRNAAKHDWSVSENGKARKESEGNLPIYIDFDDDPEKDNVEIEIWTRLREEEKATTSLTNVDDWHKKLEAGVKKDIEDFSRLPLPHRLQVLIERPFINDNGQLRRENWGLAEMKISAGYLRRSSIDVIGGLKRGEYKPENALILPTALKKAVKVDDNDVSGTYLAYRFSIPKPRELLIIVENIDDNDNVKTRIAYAQKHGVYVRTWKEIKTKGETDARALELNYRFVVHYAATKEVLTNENVKFPFRVLSGQAADVNDMVPQLGKYSNVVKELLDGKTGKGQDVDAETAAENALKAVYECWCTHIVSKYRKDIKLGKDGKIGLLITPFEHSQTGGHSLISDADILKYVMQECFKKCVVQYHVLNGAKANKDEDAIYNVFMELSEGPRNIPDDIGKSGIHNAIAKLIHDWIDEALGRMKGLMKERADKIRKEIEKCYNVGTKSGNASTNSSGGARRKPSRSKESDQLLKDRNKSFDKSDAITEVRRILDRSSIDGFITYIESVHEQVKSLFKQYEENIVSLPKGYHPKDAGTGGGGSDMIEDPDSFVKVAFNADTAKSTKDVSWIAYRRHDNSLTKEIKFAEPLSGTQSYLTQIVDLVAHLQKSKMSSVSAADFGLCARLLENGLMRMLVIDERVAKFVREHKAEVGSFYESMGITVLDDELKIPEDESPGESNKKIEVVRILNDFIEKRNPKSVSDKSTSNSEAFSETTTSSESLSDKFEILIIHQGILDKWFPNDKNDKTKMTDILNGFKKMVKYVVITTGRGTPSNIPEDAHLIPFAVVEAALFRKYPEKLILVDAVMNVLAIGKHESEGD